MTNNQLYKKVINDVRLDDIPILQIIRVIEVMEFLKAEESSDKRITKYERTWNYENFSKF